MRKPRSVRINDRVLTNRHTFERGFHLVFAVATTQKRKMEF